MSLADLIRGMAAAGAPAEAIALAVEALESASTADKERADRKRQRDRDRLREKREHRAMSRDASATVARQPPLSLPLSPQTPQTPTHTPVSINTRAREDAVFAKFWLAYPRKTAKADARKAFSRAWKKLPPLDEEEILIGGLERAKEGWGDAQFIPHPATWLNGERWQDEAVPEVINLSARKAPHERPDPDTKRTAREANNARAFAGADRAAGLRWDP